MFNIHVLHTLSMLWDTTERGQDEGEAPREERSLMHILLNDTLKLGVVSISSVCAVCRLFGHLPQHINLATHTHNTSSLQQQHPFAAPATHTHLLSRRISYSGITP